LWLSYSTVVVIVELVKRILHYPSLAVAVQFAAIVIERIKVLCHTSDKLLEAWVRFWNGSASMNEARKTNDKQLDKS